VFISDHAYVASAHVLCQQQLMALLRDKSVKMANMYSKVDWLERYGDSLGARMVEADA
jgi:hypothetical protein